MDLECGINLFDVSIYCVRLDAKPLRYFGV